MKRKKKVKVEPIVFNYNSKAALSAICFLLKRSMRSMRLPKIMAMLYLADRAMLFEHGLAIVGDRYRYLGDSIFGSEVQIDINLDRFDHNIYMTGNGWVGSKRPLEEDSLSKLERATLETIHKKYNKLSFAELCKQITSLPEWKYKNYDYQFVSNRKLLRCIGKTRAEIQAIREWIDLNTDVSDIFGPDVWIELED